MVANYYRDEQGNSRRNRRSSERLKVKDETKETGEVVDGLYSLLLTVFKGKSMPENKERAIPCDEQNAQISFFI